MQGSSETHQLAKLRPLRTALNLPQLCSEQTFERSWNRTESNHEDHFKSKSLAISLIKMNTERRIRKQRNASQGSEHDDDNKQSHGRLQGDSRGWLLPRRTKKEMQNPGATRRGGPAAQALGRQKQERQCASCVSMGYRVRPCLVTNDLSSVQ